MLVRGRRKGTAERCARRQVFDGIEVPKLNEKISNLGYLVQWKHIICRQSKNKNEHNFREVEMIEML
jgi:hypothetical protein